jgi:hypothetical protein
VLGTISWSKGPMSIKFIEESINAESPKVRRLLKPSRGDDGGK